MPGLTLALDAAANTGTIAVLRDGVLVADRAVAMRNDAEERFLPAILEALAALGAGPRDLERVICGAGPGSFTSLRVAAAIAKGLVEGLDRPLFAVPSLALLVAASDATQAPSSRWLATLDAMRGERYVALVTVGSSGEVALVEGLGLVPLASLGDRARALGATLIGPDEATRALPHAQGVVRCQAIIDAAGPVEIAGWEPVYGRLAEAQVRWEAAHQATLESVRRTS